MGKNFWTTVFQQSNDAFYNILHNIYSENGSPIFIDGKAGCGKTTLINTICDVLRSQNEIVLATATSAFAAQLYPGGKTTHSTFKVMLDVTLISYNINNNDRFQSTIIMKCWNRL